MHADNVVRAQREPWLLIDAEAARRERDSASPRPSAGTNSVAAEMPSSIGWTG
jgi:hypothetical protein